MNDLIKKLEEQINAMSFLLAGTQAGESHAWIELNQVLTELKIKLSLPDLIIKEIGHNLGVHQDYAEKTNEALSNLPSVKALKTLPNPQP